MLPGRSSEVIGKGLLCLPSSESSHLQVPFANGSGRHGTHTCQSVLCNEQDMLRMPCNRIIAIVIMRRISLKVVPGKPTDEDPVLDPSTLQRQNVLVVEPFGL